MFSSSTHINVRFLRCGNKNLDMYLILSFSNRGTMYDGREPVRFSFFFFFSISGQCDRIQHFFMLNWKLPVLRYVKCMCRFILKMEQIHHCCLTQLCHALTSFESKQCKTSASLLSVVESLFCLGDTERSETTFHDYILVCINFKAHYDRLHKMRV